MTKLTYLLVILSLVKIEKTVHSLDQPNLGMSSVESVPCVACENSIQSNETEANLMENLHKVFSAVSKADNKRETGIYAEEEASKSEKMKDQNGTQDIDQLDLKMFTVIPENPAISSSSLGYSNSSKILNITDQFKMNQDIPWPVKKEAVVEGDLVLGGLMMVHEREDTITCGPIMPQGGIQALEAMLYTLDRVNLGNTSLLPNVTLGAHILDDCDKDTYGLEIAVDFIKGKIAENNSFTFEL